MTEAELKRLKGRVEEFLIPRDVKALFGYIENLNRSLQEVTELLAGHYGGLDMSDVRHRTFESIKRACVLLGTIA
ncbi:MAG: hypothetical protein LAP85_19710 [Acidobacteriia bacterium]|nr:hypothetical protein [Terriglobia bacterium]